MGGCYKWPAIDISITGVLTNKMCTDAIRGAGRPEMTHMIEVAWSSLPVSSGWTRLQLRRKNFIPEDEFPYTDAVRDHVRLRRLRGTLDKPLEMLRPRGVPRRAGRAARQGVHRGVGFTT